MAAVLGQNALEAMCWSHRLPRAVVASQTQVTVCCVVHASTKQRPGWRAHVHTSSVRTVIRGSTWHASPS
eukprot:4249218-Amphidinium_carterae.1